MTYEQLKELEKRVDKKLLHPIDIFNDYQWRLSNIRDRLRIILNRKTFYGR